MIPNIHIHRQLAAERIQERIEAKARQRLIASLRPRPGYQEVFILCGDVYRGVMRWLRSGARRQVRHRMMFLRT